MLAPQTRIILVRTTEIVTGLLLAIAALGIYKNFYVLDLLIAIGFSILTGLAYLMGYKKIALGGLFFTLLFQPLLPLHLPRQIWVIADIVALVALWYFVDQTTNSYKKGTRFEKYVSTLFPETAFAIVNQTRDISKYLNRPVESDKHPDYVFRNKSTNKTFAVECKWRGRWAKNFKNETGLWWDLNRGARYIAYEKEFGLPVYVAFGIEGTPEKPKETYFLEASKLQNPFITQSFVRSGKIATQII